MVRSVQVTDLNFRIVESDFFLRKLKFTLFKFEKSHLHTGVVLETYVLRAA